MQKNSDIDINDNVKRRDRLVYRVLIIVYIFHMNGSSMPTFIYCITKIWVSMFQMSNVLIF